MKLSKWVGGILIFTAFVIAGKVNAKEISNTDQSFEIYQKLPIPRAMNGYLHDLREQNTSRQADLTWL